MAQLIVRIQHVYSSDSAYFGGLLLALGLFGITVGMWVTVVG